MPWLGNSRDNPRMSVVLSRGLDVMSVDERGSTRFPHPGRPGIAGRTVANVLRRNQTRINSIPLVIMLCRAEGGSGFNTATATTSSSFLSPIRIIGRFTCPSFTVMFFLTSFKASRYLRRRTLNLSWSRPSQVCLLTARTRAQR